MSNELKLQAFESLMLEIGTAMADIVEALQQGRSSNDEISTTLVDMLGLMAEGQTGKQPMDGVIAAIKALRLNVAPAQIRVEVLPTPINNIVNTAAPVVQVIERVPVDYEVKWQYDGMGRIESTRIIAQPRKAAP